MLYCAAAFLLNSVVICPVDVWSSGPLVCFVLRTMKVEESVYRFVVANGKVSKRQMSTAERLTGEQRTIAKYLYDMGMGVGIC